MSDKITWPRAAPPLSPAERDLRMRLEARAFANTLRDRAADLRVHGRDPELVAQLEKAAQWIRFLNGDGV